MTPPITPSQTVGPFFGFALPFAGEEEVVPADAATSVLPEGQVLDGQGEPVPASALTPASTPDADADSATLSAA